MKKLITEERKTTGLPKDVAEAYRNGKIIQGVFRDGKDKPGYDGELRDYNQTSDTPFMDEDGDWWDSFEPNYKASKTKNVKTLLENGIKIPVDTPVICWNNGCYKYKKHYAGPGMLAFLRGKTSFTTRTTYEWNNMELLEEMEY